MNMMSLTPFTLEGYELRILSESSMCLAGGSLMILKVHTNAFREQ